jgi:hypothetical protein
MIHMLGREFPIRAVSAGGNYFTSEEVMQVPDTFVISMDFPGQYTVVCGGSLNNAVELPIIIRGNEANIRFEGGSQMQPASFYLEPESPYRANFKEKVQLAGLEGMGRWIEKKGSCPTDPVHRDCPSASSARRWEPCWPSRSGRPAWTRT